MSAAPNGSLLPPILHPSSLYSEEARRDATRIRIYNSVLQQIYNKIKAIARIPGNEKSLWHVVPEFIPGTPRFDVNDCIVYLVWNLRNAGYTVEYTHPNLMFISWRFHDQRYREQQSPWAQVTGAARDQILATGRDHTVVPARTSQPTSAPGRSVASKPSLSIMMGGGAAAAAAAAESEVKRKTVLKKTTEYRPLTGINPETTGGAGPLSGTLPSKHVSFV
jgi:Family of unknown function (DUF5759)